VVCLIASTNVSFSIAVISFFLFKSSGFLVAHILEMQLTIFETPDILCQREAIDYSIMNDFQNEPLPALPLDDEFVSAISPPMTTKAADSGALSFDRV
jgi:hypothetical protein